MARAGTKRRSTRQAVSRSANRSIYVDPDTDDDELDLDGEEEYAPEPEAVPQTAPRKRQKTAPRARHLTRSKSISKDQAVAKRVMAGIGKKRRPNTSGTLQPKKEFRGVSDGKIPDWTSLPVNILRDVFIYASQPLHEQTRTSSANVEWLVKSARTCRAFAIPALEAYYQSPSLLTLHKAHHLESLLGIPEEKQYMHYNAKIRSLSIDVRRLAYSAHRLGLFDLNALPHLLPRLHHMEILNPADEPPFRPHNIQHWSYPVELFDVLEATGTRLRSWRWNRDFIHHSSGPAIDQVMAHAHTTKAFENLQHLTLCQFGYDNIANPAETAGDTPAVATSPLASIISLLPSLNDLTFISCEAIADDFLLHLPKTLHRLELTNCLELTSGMLRAYLAASGSQLRELHLNHNPALNLSFLPSLAIACPRLQTLKMDLRYYSERINSNDAEPLYDDLLLLDEIPTWPTTLRQLEMVHMQRWAGEAAQTLFRSLVDSAPQLPDLRRLVLHTHINIPWRQRVEFRDQWIERLNRVYARQSKPPSAYLGSLRQFRLWKEAKGMGWDVRANGRARVADGGESDGEFVIGRGISPAKTSAKGKVEIFSDFSPEKKALPAPSETIRRSRRVAEAATSQSASASPPAAPTYTDKSSDDEDEDEEEDGKGEKEDLHVQGLCDVVDIRIDNQRPRENQFTEVDFLDSEVSGDEDWQEGNDESDGEGTRAAGAFRQHSGPYVCRQQRLAPSTRVRHASTHHRHDEPTIYALSTASGRAAIAIIRISGPACLQIYHALCPGKKAPQPRYATVRTLYEPSRPGSSESVLDTSALILYFPAPRTATGEDVLELHVHGGPAVVKAVLAAISRCTEASSGQSRIRYAEPGEFTRRAFMNDRLDLTQVEALGDTLAATTEQQRRLSIRGTNGTLANSYENWRHQLLYARGELEALIDFSEDQHFDESPSDLCASVSAQVQVLKGMLDLHRRNAVRGEMLRNGISLALLGAPNAGKSSLLNCVVGREAAIVSREAGTTRDVVEIGVDMGGYLCQLVDTAGLRRTRGQVAEGEATSAAVGEVEQEGMRRARARAAESDVVIVVLSFEGSDRGVRLQLDAEVLTTTAQLVREKDNVVVVINKIDKVDELALQTGTQQTLHALPGLSERRIYPISCKAADATTPPTAATKSTDTSGIQAFLQGLIAHFHDLTTALGPSDSASFTTSSSHPDPSIWQDSLGASERHRLLLEDCVAYLDAFLTKVEIPVAVDGEAEAEAEADIVVAAEHLRGAADCLAKITGQGEAGDVEEVLGVVFEKFCVGK
ncbi:mitochondrial splicing system protein [Teratosphaeriaceae sp. CCFEE 6253]|nr:mitochondrial splicing system protein [Teratosphaeriaceae sp. CCFEE 6253]